MKQTLGSGHLNALTTRAREYSCDVYRRCLVKAKDECGGRAYPDHRELLGVEAYRQSKTMVWDKPGV